MVELLEVAVECDTPGGDVTFAEAFSWALFTSVKLI